ncbi:MAG TPA: response regulator [Polyangiales bacterium]|nr:response regulator [Polyangiales bacterium]
MKLRVLIADDSLTVRMDLAEAFRVAGFETFFARDASEARYVLSREQLDVLILDVVFPDGDGIELLREAREAEGGEQLTIFVLAGADEVSDRQRDLRARADEYVGKPYDAGYVVARARELVAARQLLRSLRDSGQALETSHLHGRKRVLAVDDSITYGQQLAKVLEGEGYEITLARSGEQAIELLSVQTFDCILLDLTMEGIGGTETCRLVKSSPSLRDVPVIVLTAIEDRASMLEGLAIGADDYIPKSAEFEVVKARVRAQLRRRHVEDETRRVREQLLRSQADAEAARSARELAETRAQLVEALERKNEELHTAYRELQTAQAQLVQSAKMASLGELVAGVAHEINNPLAFVLSHLDTTRRSLTKAEPSPEHMTQTAREHWQRAQSRLQEMQLGLERIRELVVKLRTFSRLDEGEQKTVSIRECVESLLTILSHKLKDRIHVDAQYGEPDELECFPSLLTQAIMNLVANSIDAIEGEGRIGIWTGARGDHYEVVVTDTGHGIPPHLRERVLEPFFTTKPVGQGTGLGLSIAYSIVRKHGGTLELGEASGGGTRATVRLPRLQHRGDARDADSADRQAADTPRR